MAMMSCNLMECFLLAFLLSIHFSTSYAQSGSTTQPAVTISQGTLQGTFLTTSNSRNISAFIGIPYAQPPTGDLRFANPVAANSWNGTLNATTDASVCPQMSNNVLNGDEDCLYLNVYTPQVRSSTNSSLFPVMVYIHGGGFTMMSGSYAAFGPEYLLNEDVVFVGLNYRLGPLGFLSTGDEVASGNWGLKDAVMALQWIQDNIEYFSGDPDRVTLFGESAGAAAVDILALSNATIGLIHQTITQSGSALGLQFYQPKADAATRAFQLGDYLGCSNDTSDSLISCLKTFDVANITSYSGSIYWGPTDEPDIEGAIITDNPRTIIANGVRDIPQISGVCRDEGLLQASRYYGNEEAFLTFLEDFDSLLPSVVYLTEQTDSQPVSVAAIKAYYFNDDLTANTTLLLTNYTQLIGDNWFYYPAWKALRQRLALAVDQQYFYTLNYYNSSQSSGVNHGADLKYLFPSNWGSSNINDNMSDTDLEMMDIMVQLWTSFASNGTPTATLMDGTTWELYSTTENYYLRLGNDTDVTPELQYTNFEERMQFWATLEATTNSSTGTFSSILTIVLLLVTSKFALL